MIAAITLIYGCCVWLIFAKLKLAKPSPVSIAVAVVVGVVMIGAIVVMWSFSSPRSTQLVVTRYAVQIVPQAKGLVQKIHAQPLVPLKKGDILFEILPDPFQYTVEQFTAQLAAARENVQQAEAGLEAAEASVARVSANCLAAKAAMEVAKETQRLNPNAIAGLTLTEATQQYAAATAAVDEAKAGAKQAAFALKAAQETVPSVEAQLNNAKFDLEMCTVRAPADGFVVNWQVREGTMTASLPFAAVGTFVETSNVYAVGSFGQNVVRFVEKDDPVEIALKSLPGRILTGKVTAVIPATGEGQFVTSGQLISAADIASAGMFAVRIELDDIALVKDLEMGTAGNAVIYTSNAPAFHIISKVVVRMNAWQYYLFPM